MLIIFVVFGEGSWVELRVKFYDKLGSQQYSWGHSDGPIILLREHSILMYKNVFIGKSCLLKPVGLVRNFCVRHTMCPPIYKVWKSSTQRQQTEDCVFSCGYGLGKYVLVCKAWRWQHKLRYIGIINLLSFKFHNPLSVLLLYSCMLLPPVFRDIFEFIIKFRFVYSMF